MTIITEQLSFQMERAERPPPDRKKRGEGGRGFALRKPGDLMRERGAVVVNYRQFWQVLGQAHKQ